MEYVVDASVAVKWFLPEVLSEKADNLLNRFLHHGLKLCAPDLLVPEVSNVFWKRSVLMKSIGVPQALEIHRDFLSLGLNLVPSAVLVEQAFRLAEQERHPIYDMLYLALAIDRDCEFMTADQTLSNKLRRFRQVLWLGNL